MFFLLHVASSLSASLTKMKSRDSPARLWKLTATHTKMKYAQECAHGNDILYSDTDKRTTTHIGEDIMYILVRERVIFMLLKPIKCILCESTSLLFF